MAAADLPPLPPGYSLAPTPDASPTPTPAPEMPTLPPGYSLSRQETPPAEPPSTLAKLGPLSIDTNGSVKLFGWEPRMSNLPGGIANAAMGAADTAASGLAAPADAYFGRISPTGPQNATRRALDFAQSFGMVPNYSPDIASAVTKAPTAQQLKNAATAGYDAARASSATVSGADVASMAQKVQDELVGEHGIIPKTAPKTYAILDELANPTEGAFGTYTGLEAARRGLSTIAGEGGTEGFAAKKAMQPLDNFIDSLAPEAADARANYAAAMRSNAVTGTFDKATTGLGERAEATAHASHSGANYDNALRQQVRSFLRNPSNVAGFSQPEIDALQSVVDGSFLQNRARWIGNKLGGGGGLGNLFTMGLGGYAGSHLMGPEGAAIGAMVGPALGTSAKGLENYLARRSLNSADEIIRMNSPLGRAMQAEQYLQQPAIGRDQLILKTLLPGLLGPQSPPAPQPQPFQGLLGPLA